MLTKREQAGPLANERVERPEAGRSPAPSFAAMPTLVTLALGAALPFLMKDFWIFQLTMVLIYAIAIGGLNLLLGFNGQFSLGHSAFYAIGAYTTAILIDRWEISYFVALPVAAVVCFIFGFLFGLPALRLEGIYLAMATFALALATPQILNLTLLQSWTHGVQGIVIMKPEAPLGLPLSADQWLYLFTLAVAAGLYVFARCLLTSRSGRAIMAIRDNPIAARMMGIDLSRYKSVTFGVSALYTGVAGGLAAIVVQFVAPDSFGVNLSIALVVGVVVGGVGWLPGALFGAAFILCVPNFADDIHKGLSGSVYGAIMIVLMFIMPKGVGGVYVALRRRLGTTSNPGG